MNLEKEYIAQIELGKETDTDDIEGTIINISNETESIPIEDIKTKLDSFLGAIEQIPPKYSAIKYKGKPLYKYARKGIELDLAPRKVFIKDIVLLDYVWPNLTINVTCSKGTYIRSLARDIGRKLNTFAYLKSLQRTRIGPYKLEDAYELDDFLKLQTIA